MKIESLKNNSLVKPIDIEGIKLYGLADVNNSEIGFKSIIGEFSRIRNCVFGEHCRIDRNNFLDNVILGSYSYTGPFDMIFRANIGKFVSISYGVTIGPPNHKYNRLSTHPFIYGQNGDILDDDCVITNDKFEKDLRIGNDVWIGCNSTILRGLSIGDGAVIGANTLVNKNVPPYAIVAGCPATIIKFRFSPDIIERLLKLKWWEWDKEKIRKNRIFFQKELTVNLLDKII